MNAPATDLQRLLADANTHAAAGRFADADAAFTRVLDADPDHPVALRFKSFAALQRNDFAAAEALLRRVVAREPADARSWYNLALAQYGQDRPSDALTALNESLKHNREQPPAWLYRGVLLQEAGDHEAAVVSFLRGVKIAERLGLQPADPEMQRLMQHAGATVAVALDARLDAALAPVVERFGADAVARIRAGADIFVGKRAAGYAHPKWRPGLFYIPDLRPRMFFERDEFAWTAEVEAATADIRAELEQVLAEGDGLAPYVNHAAGTAGAKTWAGINQSRDWSSFHFFRHGERQDEHCRRCPRTAAVLEAIDLQRVPGYGPEAMFSVLRPHTRIPAHYGAVNGRVIAHLPLIVPENCGALRVGDQQRSWTEGELLMFDDSFEHEAWNDSDETRVVLIFDSWNPAITPAERAAFAAVLQAAQRFEQLI